MEVFADLFDGFGGYLVAAVISITLAVPVVLLAWAAKKSREPVKPES